MSSKKEAKGLVLNTNRLRELVLRAKKGAGNDGQFPITQMLAFDLKGGTLTLTTTDYDNYLSVSEDKVEGNLYFVVAVDKFSNLIDKITSDTVSIQLENDTSLIINGNGRYILPIEVDDDGTMIKYPDPVRDMDFNADSVQFMEHIDRSTINAILKVLKPALATTDENPFYMGYFLGDVACATDQFLVNVMNVELFKNPVLVNPKVLELLSMVKEETIDVYFKDNVTVFFTPDCTLYSRNMEGIENYSIDNVKTFVKTEFPSMCKLAKPAFQHLLDRLALFVTDLDEGSVSFKFDKDGLQVSSKASDGVELIPYLESENFSDFSCFVDVTLLSKQIKAQRSDTVEMWYGSDMVLKLVDDNIIQLIALSDG